VFQKENKKRGGKPKGSRKGWYDYLIRRGLKEKKKLGDERRGEGYWTLGKEDFHGHEHSATAMKWGEKRGNPSLW